jgi:SAM-dependent methyltransferase
VPLIFEPYAAALAQRLADQSVSRILELAAGTGVVTRALASMLPPSVAITATDLNQAMIDRAIEVGTSRPVEWRQADALRLPFADATYDVVVCQFGVMFFADKPTAFAEARRVLTSGGTFLFSVWDRIEENEFADAVTTAAASVLPEDPPSFLRRIPHGYFDRQTILSDLRLGGFANAAGIETVPARSRAASPTVPAVAYCQGTPLRNEIEAHGSTRLDTVTRAAAEAIGDRFGNGAVEGKVQAHIVSVAR